MESDTIYNHVDNLIYIKSEGNRIVVICNTKDQMDLVHEKFYNSGNQLVDVEIWDDDEEQKWIVTYQVTDSKTPILN
jgi:chitinase